MTKIKYNIEKMAGIMADLMNDAKDVELEIKGLRETADQIKKYKKEITNLHKKIQRLEGAKLSSNET